MIVAALLLGRPLKWIEDRYENADRRQPGARAGDDAARRLRRRGQAARRARRLPHATTAPIRMGADANVAVHMFMWAAYKMPGLRLPSRRGWYTNTMGLGGLSRPLGDGIADRARPLLDKAARADRHRSDRDPPPQPDHRRRPADDDGDGHHRSTTSPRPNASRSWSRSIDVAGLPHASRPRRASRAAISASASPPMSSRPRSAGIMAPMTGETRADPHRADRQGHRDAEHPFAGPRHRRRRWPRSSPTGSACAYEDVTVFEGDSSRGGFSPGAAGSRQGVIGGGASMTRGRAAGGQGQARRRAPAQRQRRERSRSRTAWSTSPARRR